VLVADHEIEPNDDGSVSVDPDPGDGLVNDFDASAANLTSTPPDGLALNGAIDRVGDEDYFNFTNKTTETFKLAIRLRCSATDITVITFDGTSHLTGTFSQPCAGGAGAAVILEPGQTLFLGLRAIDDATAGMTYQLKVEPTPE
jgi:hypothetical protein